MSVPLLWMPAIFAKRFEFEEILIFQQISIPWALCNFRQGVLSKTCCNPVCSSLFLFNLDQFGENFLYMCAITFHQSWFETALDYKPQILGPKIREFPFLVQSNLALRNFLVIAQLSIIYKVNWHIDHR